MTAPPLLAPAFWRYWLPQPPRFGLSLGQIPPDFALWDVTHQRTVRLANWRGKQPVVLAFARLLTQDVYHPIDHSHIVAVNRAYEQFRNAGAEVMVITTISLRHAQGVVDDLQLRVPLLRDTTGGSFREYHTGQALGAPLPAQFILDAQGRLRYGHLFSLLHTHATPDQLLKLVEAL
ncbi:MAG: alkyl hydroperoxide reductase [Leptolyngbya sp. LCM1.Bin17]|nr:MAG: alkyl hydroperoxide reductase [Leptolyngbya sp. LCM1.Bin17]